MKYSFCDFDYHYYFFSIFLFYLSYLIYYYLIFSFFFFFFAKSEDWKNGWNESSAQAECMSKFQESPVYESCTSLANVNVTAALTTCIANIRVSHFYLLTNKFCLEVLFHN